MNIHKNARLTLTRRIELVSAMIEQRIGPAEAAREAGVSEPTARKWLGRFLSEGEELQVGELLFTVMHTPGHSPGSLCLYEPRSQALFVGDLMTRHGISRTGFTGSNIQHLSESLARIALMPDATRIFPGHGSPTVLREERWVLDLAKLSST